MKNKNMTFIYTTSTIKRSKLYGNATIRLVVYEITNKGSICDRCKVIGSTEYNTAGYRGEDSEAWGVLKKAGILPTRSKYYTSNFKKPGDYIDYGYCESVGMAIIGV